MTPQVRDEFCWPNQDSLKHIQSHQRLRLMENPFQKQEKLTRTFLVAVMMKKVLLGPGVHS